MVNLTLRKEVAAMVAVLLFFIQAAPLAAQENLAQIQERKDKKQEQIEERQGNNKDKIEEKKNSISQKKEEKKEDVVERKENIQEKREEKKEKLSSRKKLLIRAFYGRMITRFEAALNRQEKLADRIQSRLDKFATAGKNVSSQRKKLDDVRILIKESRDMISSVRQKFEDLLNSDDPKTSFEEVRKMIREDLVGKIKRIHGLLVEIINSLKGVSQSGGSATSTPATSTPSTP